MLVASASGTSRIACFAKRALPVLITATLFAPVALALPAMPQLGEPGQTGGMFFNGPAPMLGPVPVDFILFALTLLGVALFHHRTFTVALTGLLAILAYKFAVTGFKAGAGVPGLIGHFEHEWVILANLFLLLLGFGLLSRHFEMSEMPEKIPAILPDSWFGGVVLLTLIFILSAFLDNIAAALIGGVVAKAVYDGKVHIGYIAAIVAASNAGGSGSVVGDTTTTMMWIDGVSPLDVTHAYIAAGVAFLVFAFPAAIVQQRYQPIQRRANETRHIDWLRLLIVAVILVAAVAANVFANLRFPNLLNQLPVLGLAVWAAILITSVIRMPDWKVVPDSLKGTIFLLCLVTCASLMPVESLPPASWQTAFGLGFISSVFDNIPLTALALKQGGYDWGVLAYCVGFGGSMIWFGSSAGVAITNVFPEGRSVWSWLKGGWFVAVGYIVGFFALFLTLGWHPHDPHKAGVPASIEAHDGAH